MKSVVVHIILSFETQSVSNSSFPEPRCETLASTWLLARSCFRCAVTSPFDAFVCRCMFIVKFNVFGNLGLRNYEETCELDKSYRKCVQYNERTRFHVTSTQRKFLLDTTKWQIGLHNPFLQLHVCILYKEKAKVNHVITEILKNWA